jgi:mannose PTS system EIIA component
LRLKTREVLPNKEERDALDEKLFMIGLVLVTHGALASEFLAAMQHVVGVQKQITAINIGADDDVELRRAEILKAVADMNTGAGVVILTDMFGGTPSNLAISAMNAPDIEVICGINLPVLVKLAKVRAEKPLQEAVLLAQEAGRKYISIASRILGAR